MVLRRYLLGELDEQMMDQVTARMLRDKIYAERVLVAEDNLIDDYVFEGLSERELESFNSSFLINDERRKKITIARAMEVYVGERAALRPIREPLTLTQIWHNSVRFIQSHKLAVVLSGLVILFLGLLVPLVLNSLAPDRAIPPINAQRSDLEQRIAELNERSNERSNERPSAHVTLLPLVFRESSNIPKLEVGKDTQVIAINLQLPPGNRYERYRAVIQRVEGGEPFNVDLGPGGGGILTFKLTTDMMPIGDYEIQLMGINANGTSDLARYVLRVIPKADSSNFPLSNAALESVVRVYTRRDAIQLTKSREIANTPPRSGRNGQYSEQPSKFRNLVHLLFSTHAEVCFTFPLAGSMRGFQVFTKGRLWHGCICPNESVGPVIESVQPAT